MDLKIHSFLKRASILDAILFLLMLFVESCLCVRFAGNHSPAQIFVFLTFGVVAFICLILIMHLMNNGKLGNSLLIAMLFFSVVGGVVLEGLTVLGSPASHFTSLDDWNRRRLLVFCCLLFIICLIVYLFRDNLLLLWRQLTVSSLKWRKAAALLAVVSLIGVIVTFRIGASFPFLGYAAAGSIVLLTAGLCVCEVIPVHITYFLIAFTCGSMLIYGIPVTTGISWDDQIHYENALNLSYLLESQMTDTDRAFSIEAIERAQGKDAPNTESFDIDAINEHAYELDGSYKRDLAQGRAIVDKSVESIFTINEIGYIPFAFGLWLGRLLHLGFSSTAIFSKLCNVFSYALVVSLAIYVAPSKKAIFAFVGLIPTCVFLAANFSYDTWLISYTMLGFAFYLRFAWGREDYFNFINIVACFMFTLIGLAVKAVYFPLVGIYLIVPKDRFPSSRHRIVYYLSVVALGLYLLTSFALPFLASGNGGSGDVRGGAGVDSSGQLFFIISNPFRYIDILSTFIFTDYLSPFNSARIALNFGYFKSLNDLFEVAPYSLALSCVPSVLFLALGFASNDSVAIRHVSLCASIWSLLMCLCALILVATAMYISYTPVGLYTVNGCQYRYIIPILVPALSIGLNSGIKNIIRNKPATKYIFLLSTLLFAICFVVLVLRRFLW